MNNKYEEMDNEEMKKMAAILGAATPPAPKKEKPKKATKYDPAIKIDNPGEIISVFLNVYPQSKDGDWSGYPGAGWVHASEDATFHANFRQCHLKKTWHRSTQMMRTEDGYLFHKDSYSPAEYFIDKYTGNLVPVADRHQVFDGTSLTMWDISSKTLAKNCFLDEFDKKHYFNTAKIVIKQAIKYKNISVYSCKRGPFKECPECGLWYDKEKVIIRDDANGGTYCTPCYEKIAFRNVILAHDYKTYLKPICAVDESWRVDKTNGKRFRKPNNVRMFGVEAEVEMTDNCPHSRHQMAKRALDAMSKDFVYIKHDGSLRGQRGDGTGGEYGFEIVTAPADLAEHRKRWEALTSMDGFKHLRAWETETCGFHVHVSKAALTTLQVGRILVFINHPDNKKFVQRVAGRSKDKYCRFFPKDLKDGISRPAYSDDNRRQAVNTVPEKTIEFRIFRGTINVRHIIRNIEFVDAVVDFCHPGSRSLKDLQKPDGFIAFCMSNRKKWPRFCEWLVAQNYAKLPKTSAKADAGKMTLHPDKVSEGDIPSEIKPTRPKKPAVINELVGVDDDE